MMTKFKVGDKVRYIEHSYFKDRDYFKIGKEYTIKIIMSDKDVQFEEEGFPLIPVHPFQIELVEETDVIDKLNEDLELEHPRKISKHDSNTYFGLDGNVTPIEKTW